MANKQIYELTTRTFDGDSLLPISVENPDSSTATEYPQLAGKTSGNALSDFVANSQQYTTDLDTTSKTITGAINELNTGKQNSLSIDSLASGDDLDNISENGFYWAVAGVLNRPISQYGLVEVCKATSTVYLQRYTVSSNSVEDGYVYQRLHTSTGWKNWVKISV